MLDWLDPQTKALIKDIALGQLRHYLTIAGTALASYGVLTTSDQQTQFVTVGIGVATAAARPGRIVLISREMTG